MGAKYLKVQLRFNTCDICKKRDVCQHRAHANDVVRQLYDIVDTIEVVNGKFGKPFKIIPTCISFEENTE